MKKITNEFRRIKVKLKYVFVAFSQIDYFVLPNPNVKQFGNIKIILKVVSLQNYEILTFYCYTILQLYNNY